MADSGFQDADSLRYVKISSPHHKLTEKYISVIWGLAVISHVAAMSVD